MSLRATTIAPLEDEAYYTLNELLEARYGLHFPPYRRIILENRLQLRLRWLQIDTALEYCKYLQHNARELEEFVSAITNHETYFFRERDQLEAVYRYGLPLLRQSGSTADLRILSAACSSGEEVYSLVFCASGAESNVTAHVHGFDVDRSRIRMAQSGQFRQRSTERMSAAEVKQYLMPADEGAGFVVRPQFRKHVHFSYGNLVERQTYQPDLPYDVVFCRNALIYFSPASQRRVVENLLAVLRPGGFLFLGHAESVIGMFAQLKTVRLGECIAYRRVQS